MKLLKIRQNTPEWYIMRRTKIGASDCAGIILKNPYITPYQTWEKKLYGDKEESNEDIKRGHTLEKEARDWISKKHCVEYQDVCAESEERPWQIASLDCFYGDGDTILSGEIKSPREAKLKRIKKEGIPDYWLWQMQHQMSVTGALKMFFLAYTKDDQHLVWVNRNQEMIDYLNEMERVFYYEHMLTFSPPPLTDEEKRYNQTLLELESYAQ